MNTNEKRCPKCGKWGTYTIADKVCHHCGSLLDKNEIIYEDKKRKGLIPKFPEPRPFLEIKESYPLIVKIILHIIRPIYFAFMFIVSVVLWLVLWVTA